MNFKYLLFWLLLVTHSVAGTVRIAVAANVSYAMEDLKQAFSKNHPHTKIQVILGSSGKLTAQISHGAPYQVFLSANMAYPEALYAEKVAVTIPKVYAKGTLALFSVKRYDLSQGLSLLTSERVHRIATANPKTAPYGKAAKEAMVNAGVYGKVKKKFIFGESISQTVTYAVTAADIGLVATSSLYSRQMRRYAEHLHWEVLKPTLYRPIAQGVVILKQGKGDPEVKAFYDFMLGAEAKKILNAYGYQLP